MVRNTRHSRIGQELELGVFRKPIEIGEDARNFQDIHIHIHSSMKVS